MEKTKIITYGEFTKEVNKILKTNLDYAYVNRLLGLAYDQFMYRKVYKDLKKQYEFIEVLSALKNANKWVETLEFNDIEHKMNVLINTTKKNLEQGFYDQAIIEDNFEL